jgi:hypothetical protein
MKGSLRLFFAGYVLCSIGAMAYLGVRLYIAETAPPVVTYLPPVAPRNPKPSAPPRLAPTPPVDEKQKRQEERIASAERVHEILADRALQTLSDPITARITELTTELSLDGRYGAMFAVLNLPADKLQRLKQLLVERSLTDMEVTATRLPPKEAAALKAKLASETETKIATELGADVVSKLKAFDDTQIERATVQNLNSRLLYADAPLTLAQQEQLTGVLHELQKPKNIPPSASMQERETFYAASVEYKKAILEKVGTSLTDSQRAAISTLFEQQNEIDALRAQR